VPPRPGPFGTLPLTLDLEDFKVGPPSDFDLDLRPRRATRSPWVCTRCRGTSRSTRCSGAWWMSCSLSTAGRTTPCLRHPRPARARGGPACLPRRRRAARAIQALVQGARQPPQAGTSRPSPLLLLLALNAGCGLPE
jgi:hypothetical protein